MNSTLGAEASLGTPAEREWTLNVSAVAVFIWLSRVVLFVVPAVRNPASLSLSTDDAMRLAEVRDLLNGQAWFDLMQWRMNVPFGLSMHWSRLIDAPIAGLILTLRHFLNPSMAETVAICVWPMLALLAAWLAIGRIAQQLAGKKAGVIAVLFGAAGAVVLGYFSPGVIDHHNVQVALTLWVIAFLVDMRTRPTAAIGAAILCIMSVAIGFEVLPYMLMAVAVVITLWIVRGDAAAPAVRRFGVTFALAAFAILVTFTSAHERTSIACDAYSGFSAVLAMLGGLGLAAITFMGNLRQSPGRRAVPIGALCLGLFLFTAVLAPSCLHGPYGSVSSRIVEIFLSRVQEVQSPVLNAANDWSSFYYGYVYSALGLAACVLSVFLVEERERVGAAIVAAFAAMSFAVMSVEVRGILFSVLVSLPGLAVAFQLLIERWTRPGWTGALATITGLLLFSDVSFAYEAAWARELTQSQAQQDAAARADSLSWYCFGQKSVAQLARQPKGRVVAFLDQGPAVLAYSAHSVVAGPYHRNEKGILDTFDLLTKTPDVGAEIARRRRIDYVSICQTSFDYSYYLSQSGPKGLLGQLNDNRLPLWLSPLKDGGPPSKDVVIYRVLRDHLPR
jgi:hypothetical protein